MSITCDRQREEKTSGWRQMTDRVFPLMMRVEKVMSIENGGDIVEESGEDHGDLD